MTIEVAAVLADGTVLPCCMAIIGKGVVPNVEFLRDAEIRLNQGIVVDDHMATNLPAVWAAGDVAEPVDALRGKNAPSALWPSAVEGGRVAGANMAGVPQVHGGALQMNSVELLGVRVVSAGVWEGDQVVVSTEEQGVRFLLISGKPIINVPEIAILTMEAIVKKPVRREPTAAYPVLSWDAFMSPSSMWL